MILNKISLNDFGSFRGLQELSLRPTPSKPIILFGGKNGAGKSTLLDATRLCFYGQHAFGGKVSREQYLSYLGGRIHRNPNSIIQPRYSSVSLEFEFADIDGTHLYNVVRSWEDRGGGRIVEELNIERDGRVLDEVSADHWQEFIRDLIPNGVSQLFFFDGEKIQQLAEETSDQRTLAEAVKLLLGIDLIERLDADLNIYVSRSMNRQSSDEPDKLLSLEQELELTQEMLKRLIKEREQRQCEVQTVKTASDQIEQRLSSCGGGFVRNREALTKDLQRTRNQLTELRSELRDVCSGLLPFALAPQLCRQLRRSLKEEEIYEEQRVAGKVTKQAGTKIRRHFLSKGSLATKLLSSEDRKKILTEIDSILDGMNRLAKKKIVHGHSSEERRKLTNWIEATVADLPHAVIAKCKRIEQLNREEHRLQSELKKVPSDDTLAPVLLELQAAYKSLAEKNHALNSTNEEIHGLEIKAAELTKQCHTEANRIALSASHGRRVGFVPKIRSALDEFKTVLIERKIQELEQAVTGCFSVLCRKKDAIRRVSIDPTSFVVTIKGRDGHPIPKSQLSAGEKQVYAISMLWALGKTSRRPLPIIIDTPLARLDKDHRSLLAEHYFPHASHQVLILSTDTEVDEEYFDQLAPSVSKAYLLDFDSSEGCTTASPGYFWKGKSEALKAEA
jgi:DNA sulfur modification protein DndD